MSSESQDDDLDSSLLKLFVAHERDEEAYIKKNAEKDNSSEPLIEDDDVDSELLKHFLGHERDLEKYIKKTTKKDDSMSSSEVESQKIKPKKRKTSIVESERDSSISIVESLKSSSKKRKTSVVESEGDSSLSNRKKSVYGESDSSGVMADVEDSSSEHEEVERLQITPPSPASVFLNILLGVGTLGLAHVIYCIGCLIAWGKFQNWVSRDPIIWFLDKHNAKLREHDDMYQSLLSDISV